MVNKAILPQPTFVVVDSSTGKYLHQEWFGPIKRTAKATMTFPTYTEAYDAREKLRKRVQQELDGAKRTAKTLRGQIADASKELKTLQARLKKITTDDSLTFGQKFSKVGKIDPRVAKLKTELAYFKKNLKTYSKPLKIGNLIKTMAIARISHEYVGGDVG